MVSKRRRGEPISPNSVRDLYRVENGTKCYPHEANNKNNADDYRVDNGQGSTTRRRRGHYSSSSSRVYGGDDDDDGSRTRLNSSSRSSSTWDVLWFTRFGRQRQQRTFARQSGTLLMVEEETDDSIKFVTPTETDDEEDDEETRRQEKATTSSVPPPKERHPAQQQEHREVYWGSRNRRHHHFYLWQGSDRKQHQQKPRTKRKSSSKSGSNERRYSLYSTYLRARIRWALMTIRAKFLLSVCIGLFLLPILLNFVDNMIGAVDTVFAISYIGDHQEASSVLAANGLGGRRYRHLHQQHHPDAAAAAAPGSFAVVINAYKREHLLKDVVLHYAQQCGREYGISKVFVVWADPETQPPSDPDSYFFGGPEAAALETSSSSMRYGSGRRSAHFVSAVENRADVSLIQTPTSSLNGRFLPIQDLKREDAPEEAVFSVDDDIRVSCDSLYRGFHAWTTFPDSMVGYFPRLATTTTTTLVGNDEQEQLEVQYNTWPNVFLQHKFNFVLTKAAFLHKKYFDAYWSKDHPQEIRDYIDQKRNCEDLAMTLLVNNMTKSLDDRNGSPAPPIYVEGSVFDRGIGRGISVQSGHYKARSQCFTDLTRIYQQHGWDPPMNFEVSLRDYSWIRHFPGFWWQYGPSNYFEWYTGLHQILGAVLGSTSSRSSSSTT